VVLARIRPTLGVGRGSGSNTARCGSGYDLPPAWASVRHGHSNYSDRSRHRPSAGPAMLELFALMSTPFIRPLLRTVTLVRGDCESRARGIRSASPRPGLARHAMISARHYSKFGTTDHGLLAVSLRVSGPAYMHPALIQMRLIAHSVFINHRGSFSPLAIWFICIHRYVHLAPLPRCWKIRPDQRWRGWALFWRPADGRRISETTRF